MHKNELELKYWIITGYLGETSGIHSEVKGFEVFTLFKGKIQALICFRLCLNYITSKCKVAVAELSELPFLLILDQHSAHTPGLYNTDQKAGLLSKTTATNGPFLRWPGGQWYTEKAVMCTASTLKDGFTLPDHRQFIISGWLKSWKVSPSLTK